MGLNWGDSDPPGHHFCLSHLGRGEAHHPSMCAILPYSGTGERKSSLFESAKGMFRWAEECFSVLVFWFCTCRFNTEFVPQAEGQRSRLPNRSWLLEAQRQTGKGDLKHIRVNCDDSEERRGTRGSGRGPNLG